jgi:hypothetical protein
LELSLVLLKDEEIAEEQKDAAKGRSTKETN